MNLQGSIIGRKKERNAKVAWVICAVYFALVIGLEPLYRQSLFEVSLDMIEGIQREFQSKFIFNFSEYVSMLGSSVVFFPIIVLVYNFANIYKTFVLLMTLFTSTMMISIMKMIYRDPRPYFARESIRPYGCEGGWGNPSGHALGTSAFYLTLWEILMDTNKFRRRKCLKISILFFLIILVISISFSRNIVAAHSLNQILFGALLGFGLYYFIFFVLKVQVNDSLQFFNRVIKFPVTYFLIMNFIVILTALLLFFLNKKGEEMVDVYNLSIDLKCTGNSTVHSNRRLQKEALVTFSIFLANIGAFFGIKCEYYWSFSQNTQNWRQYNFDPKTDDGRPDDESLMTKITINKETQWNHTNSFYSITRILIMLLLSTVILLPYNFIYWEHNYIIVLIFKAIIPLNIASFSLFYLFKIVFRRLRMVNMTLYSMLQDSL